MNATENNAAAKTTCTGTAIVRGSQVREVESINHKMERWSGVCAACGKRVQYARGSGRTRSHVAAK